MSDRETKEKTISHPMEGVLNIEPGTTIVEYQESLPAVLTEHEEYDEKDNEIEQQFQEVYEKALDIFEDQSEVAEMVEGKFKARNYEVAAQFLNTALNAIKEKAGLKQHKDKLSIAAVKAENSGTTNQTLIVADRNDILRALQGTKE